MRRKLRREAAAPGSAVAKPRVEGWRESVESCVAVFLIFLVMGFEAQGFVIPTGSMAPTLMGRHKEVTCPQCEYVYTVDAHREVEPAGPLRYGAQRVEAGTCPNCRYQARIDDAPSFQGDRIYVLKTPLGLPFLPVGGTVALQRWDVAVFKFPEEPEVPYIKRLVGMPDEVVRIRQGDIWVRPRGGSQPFRRALRPLRHQDAMLMTVYDDAHRAPALAGDPRWRRWSAESPGGWSEPAAGTFVAADVPGDWSVLRYRHVVPDPEQWDAVREGRELPRPPRPTLITDFYSYNSDLTADSGADPRLSRKAWWQPHWVGDLSLSLRLEVRAARGRLRLELIKAGVPDRCEIDLASGLATLAHGRAALGPPAATGIRAPGTYRITFTNVDDRLTLRVDGRLPFSEGLVGEDRDAERPPSAADLEPVKVAALGASVIVSDLVLKRDIYYTLQPGRADFEDDPEAMPADAVALFDLLADPARFARLGRPPSRDYPIAPGRYMMLGDNSPWSRDARAWERTDQIDPRFPGRGWDDSGRSPWEVPESLLIGKAFCVYWPHLKPFGPDIRLGRDVHLLSRPYLERVRWIR
jgi:signal peptidase I